MDGTVVEAVRETAPLIHCITNYVTANDVANLLLAIGARPVMADDPAEAAEIIRREVNKAMRELSNYRYDPKKYEERVRERRAWEADSGRDADDG